ncbi:transposase [Nitrosomonas cryotolerans]|uniref:transposase n=1 Tax=Nitrosomonas cryotolerans TaxID=44575 RepID=UPI000940BD80
MREATRGSKQHEGYGMGEDKTTLSTSCKNRVPGTTCLRSFMNAIFYLLQSGCQWGMLPGNFPPWQTVYRYFRGWVREGTWN